MLAIVENAAGDIVKADEAEQRVIEELRTGAQCAARVGRAQATAFAKGERAAGGSDSEGKKTLLV